jgi:hypothetical protein
MIDLERQSARGVQRVIMHTQWGAIANESSCSCNTERMNRCVKFGMCWIFHSDDFSRKVIMLRNILSLVPVSSVITVGEYFVVGQQSKIRWTNPGVVVGQDGTILLSLRKHILFGGNRKSKLAGRQQGSSLLAGT